MMGGSLGLFLLQLSSEPPSDPVNLRLKEAYYIRKLRPEINNREERSERTELLF